MKSKWIIATGCAAALFVAGCESIPPGAERGPHHTMAYNVLVDASPPGARIEVNGEDVGQTPVRIKIFGDPDGTFHDFGSYYYVVKAFPLATNQFAQTRLFRTGHLLTPEDHIPSKIYFDMNQQAPNPPPNYYYGPPDYYYAPPPYYPYYYYGEPYDGPDFHFYFGPGYYHHRHW